MDINRFSGWCTAGFDFYLLQLLVPIMPVDHYSSVDKLESLYLDYCSLIYRGMVGLVMSSGSWLAALGIEEEVVSACCLTYTSHSFI